ncbi:anaphase-promoting complex subunit 1-like [Ananas comosus]|uniref:Anaphase-promoting complex subunit 1-like n=1 Tax=Ananas comosus TaxID=4615 RepID=A0A6P5EKT8_ANACO|nr:anaphase-promoting complex subunit 1-like [Ananas comosus]
MVCHTLRSLGKAMVLLRQGKCFKYGCGGNSADPYYVLESFQNFVLRFGLFENLNFVKVVEGLLRCKSWNPYLFCNIDDALFDEWIRALKYDNLYPTYRSVFKWNQGPVFLATDIDGMPIICFLFSEQRILLAVRLQIDEANDDVLIDIKPHMSWNYINGHFPPLICRDKSLVVSLARKIVSFYSLLLGAERTGRKLSTGVYCEVANGSVRTVGELTVLAMVGERFGRQYLDLLPVGVSLPLRHALDKCRESPPTDWPASAYVLVGREDLAMAKLGSLKSQDDVNLTSISVPYMLHLRPVTSPSFVSDITRSDSLNPEDSDSLYRSVEDGMEHIFNSSTQLRYGHDLRFNEVRRLLCSARPVAIHMSVNPSASNQDLQQVSDVSSAVIFIHNLIAFRFNILIAEAHTVGSDIRLLALFSFSFSWVEKLEIVVL